jgi:hypothetical protein
MVPLTVMIPAVLKRKLAEDAYLSRQSVSFLVRRVLEDAVPVPATLTRLKAQFPEGTFVEPTLEQIP